MLILLTSVDALLKDGEIRDDVAIVLMRAKANGIPVGVVSNRTAPSWFTNKFGESGVQFLRVRGRQNGQIILQNAKTLGVLPHDCLVLAANDDDIQMGKNGHAVLIGAGWARSEKASELSIRASDAAELSEVLDLLMTWAGAWWFRGDGPLYSVRALADLSQFYKPLTQQQFSKKLTSLVKDGGPRLNVLLALCSRSLLVDCISDVEGLFFGVYPSSDPKIHESEVLTEFSHRLRTAVSRVRFADRGNPLFLRHHPSIKRSSGGGNRQDPTNQMETLHLNPYYEKRLIGRNVFVLDDCTSHGVSFGVASALLRAAGVKSVTGVALGKFGNVLQHYDIEVFGSPFQPLSSGDWTLKSIAGFDGASDKSAHESLKKLFLESV